jgi:hypothetical protein
MAALTSAALFLFGIGGCRRSPVQTVTVTVVDPPNTGTLNLMRRLVRGVYIERPGKDL